MAGVIKSLSLGLGGIGGDFRVEKVEKETLSSRGQNMMSLVLRLRHYVLM
jgi:hypothetical protein